MAYNPFNIFRRNQKALFAVLTVFIMIMFTLSFGSNDFFERFARWIGKGRGEAVCKIDGRTIKDSDLARVRRQRVLANSYMTLAAGEAANRAKNFADQQQAKLGGAGKQMADAVRMAQFGLTNPQLLGGPARAQQALFSARNEIEMVLENPNSRTEDREVARAYRTFLDVVSRGLATDDPSHFFLNVPNKTSRDTIEFILWEKKADQLGIDFTRDDVKLMFAREFSGFFGSDVEVRKEMTRRNETFTMEGFWDALAAEFRVRAAQNAVFGRTGAGLTAFGTPYEMFEYYQKQCSPATYKLMAIPALAFVAQVKAEPTEAELGDFYKKHQDDEPNPARETPGFKDPRKLSISWLAITGEEPYYQKLAAEQVKVGEVMAKAFGMLAVPVPGGDVGWAATAAAPLSLKEPAVDAAYSTYKSEFEAGVKTKYQRPADFVWTSDLLPSSTVRPGTMAAVLGAMAGESAPFGNPAVAASLAMGAPIGYEVRDRIKVGLPLALGVLPNPAWAQTVVGGAAASKASEPQPLPIEAMRPELLKTTVKKRVRELVNGNGLGEKGDIARFSEEVEKLSEKGKAKDKSAAEKYIAEFKAARGLTKPGEQFGSSTGPRTEWDVEEDLALAPLAQAQREALLLAGGAHGGDRYVPFGRSFFWSQQFDQNTMQMRSVPSGGAYSPRPFPPEDVGAQRPDGRPRYVFWATEDVPPKKTLNLSTAKTSEVVKAAWKRMKARELAAQYAKDMAERIQKSGASSPTTIQGVWAEEWEKFRSGPANSNTKAYFAARQFDLRDVCPFVPMDSFGLNPEMRGQLRRFMLPPSENVPFPGRNMEKELLDNREKPTGTSLVLPDAAKDTFYVATLVKRDLKTPDEFRTNVYSPLGRSRDAIVSQYQREVVTKSRQSVIDLLKKEFKYVETDEQKKKLDDAVARGERD